MELRIKDDDKKNYFFEMLSKLKYLTDHTNLSFTKEHLLIQGIDSSKICLFECKIQKEWFCEYNFIGENSIDIGISCNIMHEILKHNKKMNEFILVASNDSDVLELCFDKKHTNNYCIPLIDIEMETFNIEMPESNVDLGMKVETLTDILTQHSLFSDDIQFIFKEEEININANGIRGKLKTNIPFDNVEEYCIGNETITKTFSLKYLMLMCKFNKLSELAELTFNKTMPMTFKYSIDNDLFYLKFYLAEKMDDNT